MANLTTAADLLDDILFRAGELQTAGDRTSDLATQALIYLNRVYQCICLGGGELLPDMAEEWWWLRKSPPGTVILEPSFATGTVSLTNNLTSGSFSAAPAASKAGWFLKVQGSSPGHADVPRISTHTAAATAFTLDAVWTGDTGATYSYDCFKLEYELAATDILRLISPFRQYRESDPEYDVDIIDALAMDAGYPVALVTSGTPSKAAVVKVDSSSLHTLRFNRWGGTAATELVRLEYDYLYMPAALTDAAGSIPAVPHYWRRVLADWALFFLHSDKNDERAAVVGAQAKAGLRAMERENQKKQGRVGRFQMGRISPRPADSSTQGVLRTSSGLIIG